MRTVSEQKHWVKRQVIELVMPTRLAQADYGAEMGRLFRQKLVPLIDQICSELCPPGQICRIDRLELDLGSISVQQLETQFVANFASGLRQALAKQISMQMKVQDEADQTLIQTVGPAQAGPALGAATRAGDEAGELAHGTQSQSALALFDGFLHSGTLPWWAEPQQPQLLHDNLHQLLQEMPHSLLGLVQKWLPNNNAMRRIISQYLDAELAQLGALLAPDWKAELFDAIPGLIRALQTNALAGYGPASAIRHVVWRECLRLADAQRSVPPQAAWQALLAGLALQLDCDLADLTAHALANDGRRSSLNLNSAGFGARQAPSEQLSHLLNAQLNEQLNEQLSQLQQASNEPLRSAWRQLQSQLSRLPLGLRQSLQRILRQSSRISAQAVDQHAAQTSTQNSARNILPLLQRGKQFALYRCFSEANPVSPSAHELIKLLRRAQSRGGPYTEICAALLVWCPSLAWSAQANWLAALTPALAELARPGLAQAIVKLLQADAVAHGLSNAQCQRVQALLPMHPAQVQNQPQAVDICNAGLVIIWPFLNHLFTRLGLLEERDFKDLAARQRACGLLQVLANPASDGLANIPEYLLPLNKLLCGLEPDHPFEFGRALTRREVNECQTLIQAVIAQAPILNNLSVAGFAGSFILRPGRLSMQDDHALLRVQGQTYDIVLGHLPWGWEWVKLPWMTCPLRVEWES